MRQFDAWMPDENPHRLFQDAIEERIGHQIIEMTIQELAAVNAMPHRICRIDLPSYRSNVLALEYIVPVQSLLDLTSKAFD